MRTKTRLRFLRGNLHFFRQINVFTRKKFLRSWFHGKSLGVIAFYSTFPHCYLISRKSFQNIKGKIPSFSTLWKSNQNPIFEFQIQFYCKQFFDKYWSKNQIKPNHKKLMRIFWCFTYLVQHTNNILWHFLILSSSKVIFFQFFAHFIHTI